MPTATRWTLRAISRVGRILFFNRGRNGGGDPADVADGLADAADRAHAIAGRRLNRGNLARDLVGRFRGLARQRLHLGCDHGEAAAGFSGARRLDGGVERQ